MAKKATVKKKTTRKPRRRKHEVNLQPKKMPAALRNAKTRRVAIHAMCYECIYDPNEKGSWRAQVEACVSPNCPLYEFRPKTVSSEIADKADRKRSRK